MQRDSDSAAGRHAMQVRTQSPNSAELTAANVVPLTKRKVACMLSKAGSQARALQGLFFFCSRGKHLIALKLLVGSLFRADRMRRGGETLQDNE